MKKVFIVPVLIAAVLFGGFYLINNYIYNEKQADEGVSARYKDGRYIISGQFVQLVDGVSKTPIEGAPGAFVTTQYFGNEVQGDFDADGDEDVAFIMTEDGGGSGTFFYLVGAIKEEGGYRGTHAVFIGDRIAPQTTEFRDGKVIVNYADRKPDDAMAAVPSVGKSLFLKYDPESMTFGEVVQNFEGEADPSRMSLGMKTWNWIRAGYNDDTEIIPKKADVFTITFGKDGQFSATTDCNSMSGSYAIDGNQIEFGPIAMTKMFCQDSQEGDFAKLLQNTSSYFFTSRGELILELKFDSGTATFR